MRNKIVAGNWKMNKLYSEAVELVDEITIMLKDDNKADDVIKILIPAFPYIRKVVRHSHGIKNLFTGAQNCASEEGGAYTGEVSAAMIKSLEATYVIIGHSERRSLYNETHEDLKKKVNIVLGQSLTPIFCVGETKEVRQSKKHFEIVEAQIKDSLFHLSAAEFGKLVLAYEPVWAIGTGLTATSAQAQEMHHFIRTLIEKKYGKETANAVSILYGGSCNAKNAEELFACPDVDGGLIGGAALVAKDFITIIHSFPK
jgi:triosephosphate isomerase (TIM)